MNPAPTAMSYMGRMEKGTMKGAGKQNINIRRNER